MSFSSLQVDETFFMCHFTFFFSLFTSRKQLLSESRISWTFQFLLLFLAYLFQHKNLLNLFFYPALHNINIFISFWLKVLIKHLQIRRRRRRRQWRWRLWKDAKKKNKWLNEWKGRNEEIFSHLKCYQNFCNFLTNTEFLYCPLKNEKQDGGKKYIFFSFHENIHKNTLKSGKESKIILKPK